ncbi:serine/threonine-protein kinase [Nonomuraea sp. SYSU D8015]|uniref:serine/threonine-protein kinase n=1 Tax=Nonomuraea sp. SYSU D8015 TaxID=2593644 RepID=UPI0016609992|nr:serine/threonine-protein kinase [Nonomuraea sp. SYSU D8015]
MSDQIRRIGPYAIVRKLGEGGMGVVYLAQDPEFRPVALKVLKPELAGRDDFRRRFTREAEAARKVARFCTAPVLDAGIEGETAYIVTEYVEGPDLASLIEQRGPMSGANLEALAVGVATALAAIHEAGIVHRDLKPSNILLSAVGPRVIDFGIARQAEPDATRSAAVVGTPAYMAPEQASGGPITAASDVFAWGGVVTYAGTGRPPFGTGAVPEVLYRVAHHVPVLDGLDERLRRLVEEALHKEPDRRPTAQQLLDRMLGRERATVVAATRAVSDSWTPLLTQPPPPPPPVRPGRRWVAPAVSAVLAAVLAAGGTVALWRPWESKAATAGSARSTVTMTQTSTVTATATPEPASSAPVPTKTVGANAVITPGKEAAVLPFLLSLEGGGSIRGLVQIDSLVWQGPNVKLQFTIRSDAARASTYVQRFFGIDEANLGDIVMTLPGETYPIKPMWNGDVCACTTWGYYDEIEAGQSKRFYAVFRRVPKSAKTVDLDLLKLGLFKNVLIAKE